MEDQVPTLNQAEMERAMRISVIDGMLASAGETRSDLSGLCAGHGSSKDRSVFSPHFLPSSATFSKSRRPASPKIGASGKLVVVTSVPLGRHSHCPDAGAAERRCAIYTFIFFVTLRFINNIRVPS